MSKLDMKREFVPVNFAILTVSDTRSFVRKDQRCRSFRKCKRDNNR